MRSNTMTRLSTEKRRKNKNGFSLVELLIVIAIIGVLVAVGYPSYTDFILKSRRADGTLALMEATQAMERCKSTQFSYSTCTLSGQRAVSPEGYYNVALTPAPTASAFTIVATPTGIQVGDTECATIVIDHLGRRTSTPGATGTDENGCWN